MTTITIHGKELSINMLSADTMERYETLNKKICEDIKDPKRYEGKSAADSMREQIGIIDKYLDDLFGEGTAASVFDADKSDLEMRIEAFAECAKLGGAADERVREISSRYGFNRAQRRAAAKAGK